MRVEAVSLTLGAQKLAAVVTDPEGHRRRIELVWFVKDATDVPLPGWLDSLRGEVEYQRAQELAAARGVVIP